MIVFEAAASPAVRAAEVLIAGRRVAARLYPYGSGAAGAACRFDPVDRRFHFGGPEAIVEVGPADAGAWRTALARVPSGPVVVGPCSPAEPIRGAFRAAVDAAVGAARPVYLLDPDPAVLPGLPARSVVVLCSWRPGRTAAAFPGIASARDAGLPAAALFPLLPGWTGEPALAAELVAVAGDAGAQAVTALAPADDGEGRRAIVEARDSFQPQGGDTFFELVHHGDWPSRLPGQIALLRAAAAKRGLAWLPPRPSGRGQPPGNAAAAARLEVLAEQPDVGEHRIARLHAAVRWIDESVRDLALVEREGNLRRIFPFGDEIANEAAATLRETR